MKHRYGMTFAAALAAVFAAHAAVIGPEWRIVVPDRETTGVSAAIAKAAEALADDLEEGTGLRIPVVAKSKAGAGRAIYIGGEFAAAKGLVPGDLATFDNVIAERDGDIYLFGNDRTGRANERNTSWFNCVLPSVRATTRFMRKAMGVAFVMPGRMGRGVPKRERIALADGTFDRENPEFGFGASGRIGEMMQEIANNSFGNGSFYHFGGHTYPTACPARKYFKDHPEYFALIGGERKGDPANPALCISNPAVRQLVIDELLRKLDAGADVVQLGQQDGTQLCGCGACAAYGGPEAKDWGEKFWLFHADIAREIGRIRSGKKVLIISYSATAAPPRTFRKFPGNVMVEICDYRLENLRRWKEYDVPNGFTIYTYLWGCYNQVGCLPKHSFVFLAEFVRMLREYGFKGIFRCGYGDLYGLEGPGYYVFNRLLEDRDANIAATVQEYCEGAYGPAAPLMQAFHETLDHELAIDDLADRNRGWVWDRSLVNGTARYADVRAKHAFDRLGRIYNPKAVRRMEDCLARAERTPGLTARMRKRLELVRLEWDYARTMGEIATYYAAYQKCPCEGIFSPLGDAVLRRNGIIARIYPDGAKRPAPLADWPEMVPYGGTPLSMFRVNGQSGGAIGAPLVWDIPFLREKGILPGSKTKTAVARRAAAKPALGDFEAGVWAAASWNDLGGIQLEPTCEEARFKVLYDDENLYFACDTKLADDATMVPVGPDGRAYEGHSMDIFIDPTGTKSLYYHLIWNPCPDSWLDESFATHTDPLHPKYNAQDADWNGGWKIENARGNGRWKSLITVPYASLGGAKPPKAGDTYALNVGRCTATTGRSTEDTFALWSPNLESRSFVNVDAMGFLKFE